MPHEKIMLVGPPKLPIEALVIDSNARGARDRPLTARSKITVDNYTKAMGDFANVVFLQAR